MASQKFTGKERDAESSLDYFIARYYSAAQGRFASPDPGAWYFLNPQSYNAYSYALNNPLRYDDEDGESARDRVNAANDLAARNIPYVWGGTNPNPGPGCGLDCSGLVLTVFKSDPDNSLVLPRSAPAQAGTFQTSGEYTTDMTQAQSGDAIFFANSSGNIVHTGIVVDTSNGVIRFVHAPGVGKNVRYASVSLGSRKFGAQNVVGFGRSIEHPSAQSPQRSPGASTGILGGIMSWWNSWSLSAQREAVTSTIMYPKPKKPKKNDLDADEQY